MGMEMRRGSLSTRTLHSAPTRTSDNYVEVSRPGAYRALTSSITLDSIMSLKYWPSDSASAMIAPLGSFFKALDGDVSSDSTGAKATTDVGEATFGSDIMLLLT